MGDHTAAYGTAAKEMLEDFVFIDDYIEDFAGTSWDGCLNFLESWTDVLTDTDLVVNNYYLFRPSLQIIVAYVSEKFVSVFLTFYLSCPSSHEYFICSIQVSDDMG